MSYSAIKNNSHLRIAHRRNKLHGPQIIKIVGERVKHDDSGQDKLRIFDKKTYHFIPFNQILYCQAFNNYCTVYVVQSQGVLKPFLVAQTLKSIQHQLPSDRFCRTHQSYLVNKNAIRSIVLGEQQFVELKYEKFIPISRRRRKILMEKML